MDRKELTSGEAESMEYAYRVPFYSTMELFIETLTGTCFELRVSPFETVISVKAKIQRLEGIPISQQYLIWQNMELEDDYCLHDYSIMDGCTLKLVLAMRGGPINTRRIAMEEPSFREMADYVDANQEELFENLSTPPSAGNNGSNKQVTLLVYRDGDQLNFFRVVDRGDGTLTPLSESLSGGSISNMEEEEEAEMTSQQKWTVSQVEENNVTASKMKQLRSHMHNLNIKGGTSITKKTSTAHDETPSLPPGTKENNPLKLSVVRRHLSFSPKAAKEISKLPPTSVKMTHVDSFGDLPSSQAPRQPPPSAEELKSIASEITPHKPLKSSETKHSLEKSVKSRVMSSSKPGRKLGLEESTSSLKSEGEVSEGEVTARKGRVAVKEVNTAGSETPGRTVSSKIPSSTNTITKAELLRARLNRIKQTMNTETESTEPNLPSEPVWRRDLSESGHVFDSGDGGKFRQSGKVEFNSSSDISEDSSGKRSPRTQRLLAALSNNGKTATSGDAKKKVAVSSLPRFPASLPQGMAFNRHEMYLRSYGLLASPDDEFDEDVVKNLPASLPETTVTKQRAEEIAQISSLKSHQASKILETPHGVKYTTTGTGASYYGRPWYDRTPRSPVTAAPRSHTASQGPHSVKDNAGLDNASTYSLFHPYNRDLKPIGRPTQGHHPMPPGNSKLSHLDSGGLGLGTGAKHSYSSYGRPSSNWSPDRTGTSNDPPSTTLNSIHRWSGTLNQKSDKNSDLEGTITMHGSKETSTNPIAHHPRPPSSSTTGVSTLRYHSRRQKGNSKAVDKLHTTQSATNPTTSGVRMNDSPHGKLETMSRQEAREVVDFINKAVDASILRSLVKSPGKESHRGSSGQSSYRHAPLPYHQYGDSSRLSTETGPKYTTSNSNRMGSKIDMAPLGAPRIPISSAHSRMHHPPSSGLNLLPPVKPTLTKKKRCFLCSKKTGLATSYTCRCGNNFCATHRYAETHDCTYDYKTRGRKLLEENNPLVSAPKLPKI